MKKGNVLKKVFLIAFIAWGIVLVKQQISIAQYNDEIKALSTKIEVAEDELNKNKEDLKAEKEIINSPEYIEKLAREKLGMYLQNERVYIDSNM